MSSAAGTARYKYTNLYTHTQRDSFNLTLTVHSFKQAECQGGCKQRKRKIFEALSNKILKQCVLIRRWAGSQPTVREQDATASSIHVHTGGCIYVSSTRRSVWPHSHPTTRSSTIQPPVTCMINVSIAFISDSHASRNLNAPQIRLALVAHSRAQCMHTQCYQSSGLRTRVTVQELANTPTDPVCGGMQVWAGLEKMTRLLG